jgi:glycosyltransferase involved in cell wall biosynthesis
MMKVMHILGNFGPGGAEMGVVRLIRSFQSDDIIHSVCSISSNTLLKELLPDGTNLYTLGIEGACYTAFSSLLRLFKKTKTDIAHVNNLAPWFDVALGSKLAGCKCIETFHGIEEKLIKFPVWRRGLLRTACALSTRVTAVSESSKDLLVELSGIKKHEIEVIPNGVDTDIFCPPLSYDDKKQIRANLNLPEDRFLIGCVSALRPVKGHEGLMRAFALFLSNNRDSAVHENANLVLVGDGPLFSELRIFSRQLGIEDKVVFMGRRNDVQDILRAIDVFVLNSETEGMSYAVLEAMSSGLPVIASAVGANIELVNHGAEGYLVSHGDVESLAGYVIKLGNDESLLSKMGKNAREKIIKAYSLGKMVSSYKDLYREFYCGN